MLSITVHTSGNNASCSVFVNTPRTQKEEAEEIEYKIKNSLLNNEEESKPVKEVIVDSESDDDSDSDSDSDCDCESDCDCGEDEELCNNCDEKMDNCLCNIDLFDEVKGLRIELEGKYKEISDLSSELKVSNLRNEILEDKIKQIRCELRESKKFHSEVAEELKQSEKDKEHFEWLNSKRQENEVFLINQQNKTQDENAFKFNNLLEVIKNLKEDKEQLKMERDDYEKNFFKVMKQRDDFEKELQIRSGSSRIFFKTAK